MTNSMRSLVVIAASLVSVGCNDASLLESGARGGNSPADGLEGTCAKIEGADIGVENLSLAVGGKVVTFHSWVNKAGEAAEFVGFSYAVSGGAVVYTVKAGGELHPGNGSPWMHPAGVDGGSEAPGVSNVVVCDPDDDGGDDGDPDDGDPDSGDPDDGDPDTTGTDPGSDPDD